MAYTEQDWTAILPSATKTKLQAMDAGIKTAQDTLDLESAAGKAMTRAANATAQVALLPDATAAADGKATAEQIAKLDGIEASADVTDKANVAAAIESGAETTAPADTDIAVGVKSDHTLLYYTWLNIWKWIMAKIHGTANKDALVDADKFAIIDTEASNVVKTTTYSNLKTKIKALFGFVANAVGFEMAGGTTSKKLTVDTDATISTLTASQLAAAIEGGTATTTPLDTSIVPGVKADHSRLYYTWANIWAWVIGKFEAGTATATPADTDIVPSISAAHAAQKSTWAQIKAAIVAGVKATAAQIVTGTSDLLLLTVKGLKDSLALDGSWITKRTKMPDGATAVISEDDWLTTAGFAAISTGTVSKDVTPGMLCFTRADDTAMMGVRKNTALDTLKGKTLIFKYYTNSLSTGNIRVAAYDYSIGFRSFSPSVTGAIGTLQIPADYNPDAGASLRYITFYSESGAANDWFKIDWYWIGNYSYLPGSLSEEAARIANLRGDMPGVGAYALQTITATNLATATKGDTIGGKKYTYVAALTASPGVEGEILKEATKEAELENLNLAISEAARTNNGVKYWAAAVHPLVSSARVNEVLTLTAKTKNGPENAITVVCESGTNHTAGAATLLGGYTDSAAKTIAEIQNNIAGSGTRPAAAKIELTNTLLIGYETTVDVAQNATLTLPAGGTWYWNVYGYGATISSAKRGNSAGGSTLTVAGANASVSYRRVA